MKRIKLLLVTGISLFAFVLMPTAALAQAAAPKAPAATGDSQSKQNVCDGLELAGGKCGADGDKTIQNVIKAAIRIFQTIIGVIAVFTIITAGLTYITSAGDGGKTATAKNRIMYSAIGLVVVALAEVIVQFALNQVPK